MSSTEEAKDSARLDFMIKKQCFVVEHVIPAGKKFQVWDQDEDENFHVLSSEGMLFDTPRDALDAAMRNEEQTDA